MNYEKIDNIIVENIDGKERPILFATDMVKAIIEDKKTETRRRSKHQYWSHSELVDVNQNEITQKIDRSVSCPYGQPGDILWVRETWRVNGWDHEDVTFDIEYADGTVRKDIELFDYSYKNDEFFTRILDTMGRRCEPRVDDVEEMFWFSREQITEHMPWKPSIHMPKAAARIWLEVLDSKIERLNDITEKGCMAEGLERLVYWDPDGDEYTYPCFVDKLYEHCNAIDCFKTLWQSINGPASWDENPWVWVVKFKVLSTTGRPNSLKRIITTKNQTP